MSLERTGRASNNRLQGRRVARIAFTAVLVLMAVLWLVGMLDYRVWYCGYREWRLCRAIPIGTTLDKAIQQIPSPHNAYGHGFPEFVQFDDGTVITANAEGKVVRIRVKWPPASPFIPVLTWVIMLVLAGATVYAWWPKRSVLPGHCRVCDYNLTGNVSGRCPECGTELAAEPKEASTKS